MFANIAKPLRRLGEKGKPFKWAAECDVAFSEPKRALVTPVLAYPCFNAPFMLDTIASVYSFGATLTQEHKGLEQVVTYDQKILSSPEINY